MFGRPIAERALEAVDGERGRRDDQCGHQPGWNGELLFHQKMVRQPGGHSHHRQCHEEEPNAAERLPAQGHEHRDATDGDHPAEVVQKVIERELRAVLLLSQQEAPQRRRLSVVYDPATDGGVELGPFNLHDLTGLLRPAIVSCQCAGRNGLRNDRAEHLF